MAVHLSAQPPRTACAISLSRPAAKAAKPSLGPGYWTHWPQAVSLTALAALGAASASSHLRAQPLAKRGKLRCSGKRCRTLVALAASPSAKSELLELLSGENWDASRVNAAQRVEDLVAELVASFDKSKLASEDAQQLLAGRWKLLNTFTPGQTAALRHDMFATKTCMFSQNSAYTCFEAKRRQTFSV